MDHSPSPHRTCSLARLGRISRRALGTNVMNVCVSGCVKRLMTEMMCGKNESVRSRCGLSLRRCVKRICVSSWTWCFLAHVVYFVALLDQGGISQGKEPRDAEVVPATITTILCTPEARGTAVSWQVQTDRRGGSGKRSLGKEGDRRGGRFCDMTDGKLLLEEERLECCGRSESFGMEVF